MDTRRSGRRAGSNRVLFFVVVGLAAAVIVCALSGQTFGWSRLCGGGIALLGGFFLLLAEDKRWPLILLLVGLVLFFADSLLTLFNTGG